MTPAQKISAVFAAAAIAAPGVVRFEGWATDAYNDPVGIATACAGVTADVVRGRAYSEGECVAMTAAAIALHGARIVPCLADELPPPRTFAAFISFAYNVGEGAFCRSTLARKARAGDLAGACAELPRWIYAGGRQLPGLVTRRAAERALCESGLSGVDHA
jgi:lysozyme